MTPTEPLHPALLHLCQTEALGQVLTSWTEDGAIATETVEPLEYDSVLRVLRNKANNTEAGIVDERIIVWEPFEDYSGKELADLIEQICQSHTAVAFASRVLNA
jgi:hypothetical protein